MWSGAFVYTPDDEADAFPLLMDDEVDAMDLGDLNHPYDAIMPDLPFPEQVRRRPSREDRSRHCRSSDGERPPLPWQCDFLPGDSADCDLGSE